VPILGIVSSLAIRRAMCRLRRRAAGLVLVVAIVGAVAAHHSNLGMDGLHHDATPAAAPEMCLGAFTAIGAAVVAVAIGVLALGRWRPALLLMPGAVLMAPAAPMPRARAGPPLLTFLCVSRR
jgi:hypothetical protein